MKRHFCASAFVVNPYDKKILLIKHKKNKRWTQPGGHIEGNETPEETALREEKYMKKQDLGLDY